MDSERNGPEAQIAGIALPASSKGGRRPGPLLVAFGLLFAVFGLGTLAIGLGEWQEASAYCSDGSGDCAFVGVGKLFAGVGAVALSCGIACLVAAARTGHAGTSEVTGGLPSWISGR